MNVKVICDQLDLCVCVCVHRMYVSTQGAVEQAFMFTETCDFNRYLKLPFSQVHWGYCKEPIHIQNILILINKY